MLKIYYLILPGIILYVAFRAIQDKTDTLEKFIRKELDARKLQFVSSTPCKNLSIPEIENIPIIAARDKRRIGIGTATGGYASMIDSSYKIIRTVGYEDDNGKLHEAYAAIEFSGFFFRRFLGISWNPEPK